MSWLRSSRLPSAHASAAHARHRLVRKTSCRPSRLTAAAAAATVLAAMAAIAVVIASGGGTTSAAVRAGDAAAIGHGMTVGWAGQAGPTLQKAGEAVSAPQGASQHLVTSRLQAPTGHQVTAAQRRPAWPASQASSSRPAQAASPPQPYLIYDSLTPEAIPPGQVVATYATGPLAPSPSEVAGRSTVLWIDTTGTDYAAPALDVEPGNVGPAQAATWAYGRLSSYPKAFADVYTFLSEWPACQAAIATLPAWMQARVHWWIADPTGVPHMVPGAWATQWYWGPNYDISTATSGF
jgi:hypothetical protein